MRRIRTLGFRATSATRDRNVSAAPKKNGPLIS